MDKIFLDIDFDIKDYKVENKKILDDVLKNVFSNKWLYICLHNFKREDKVIIDKIYDYSNTYGVKISLKIDKNIEILQLIEYNYSNIECVIFENDGDLNKYKKHLKRLGIKVLLDKDTKKDEELICKISLNKILTKS